MEREEGPVPNTAQASTDPSSSARRRGVPPSLAERYEDIHFVGEGGMGTVYRGRDPRLGRAVALKLIKGDDPDLGRRFIQEARTQARIQHEHVCRVYEAGQANGEPYIAMQFIDGEPLSRMKDRLTLEQRVKIMREVAAAVHEAHRLGMIHRDIKPGNILVETLEDGALKPYIMDFGLAREVEERGQTMTGAVVGTPAYMPPEQALGEVHSMDRRSDVYSLGATLYDLLAGRPPFVAEHPWKLLVMVGYEEVPLLGKVKKGVPAELETIVMKCLEREPARRYESARALGDDLQRFLDGDPIQARRASFGYVLWKRARKHKAVAVLGVLLVAAALVVLGVWVKGRRDAAEGARIAQQLGEGVKEMELFLRSAYELPLHDVERERDVVRGKLAQIELRMAVEGRAAEGPGHYAVGRGHLSLGDPERAREHLERAVAAGYTSAELDYALGRALGELYRRALEETRRIANQEERKKRVAELEGHLRDPALGHLRAAVAAQIEVPAYAEGLIALYEGRNEEALAKAKEAREKAPWLYEAKKLEGDALYALGSRYRHDAEFDYDKMMAHFTPAGEAYRAAAEMARSDPEVHRAACELWEKEGWGAKAQGKNTGSAFDEAEAACARAVQASPRDGSARVQLALVASARIGAINEEDWSASLIDSAIRVAEDAVGARATDPMAHYALSRALLYQAKHRFLKRQDASTERVVASYTRALELDPSFTWALNELGKTYLLAADLDRLWGRDPRPALESALQQFARAVDLDPAFLLPLYLQMEAHAGLVECDIEHGQADEAAQARAARLSEGLASLERRRARPLLLAYWKAKTNRLRGRFELIRGHDPRPFTASAIEATAASTGPAREDYWLLFELGESRLVEAEYALRSATDPQPSLRAAREAVQRALRVNPGEIWGQLLAARIEVVALRASQGSREVREADFEAGFAPVRPVLEKGSQDPLPYALVAEVHALRAAWAQASGKDPERDLVAGLEMAQQALEKNPHLAIAHAAKGRLFLVQARSLWKKTGGTDAARNAKEALEAAFRENPLLAREHGAALKEATQLL